MSYTNPTFYTLGEAAEIAKCSTQTLRKAIKEDKLMAGQTDREYRIRKKDLYKWMGVPEPKNEPEWVWRQLLHPMNRVVVTTLSGEKESKMCPGLPLMVCRNPPCLQATVVTAEYGKAFPFMTHLSISIDDKPEVLGQVVAILGCGQLSQATVTISFEDASRIWDDIEENLKDPIIPLRTPGLGGPPRSHGEGGRHGRLRHRSPGDAQV
jgi:excisionase family DNA binding protein